MCTCTVCSASQEKIAYNMLVEDLSKVTTVTLGLGWSAAGDPMLGSPVVSSSAADGAESGSATFVLNTVELQDYLAGQGEWTLAQDTQAGNPGSRQQHALGRVVAELSAFAQRLRKRWDALPPPVAEATKEGEPKAPLTAAEAVAAGESADATPGMIQAMPLKLAVVSAVSRTIAASANVSRTLQVLPGC